MIESFEQMSLRVFFDVEDIVDSDMEMLDKEVNLVSLLGGMTPDEVLNMPLDEFGRYTSKLKFITDSPKRKIPQTTYVVNGRKYNVLLDADSMSVAQYVDYSSYCREEDEREKIIGMLSVFLIPRGKKYGEYDIKQVREDMLEMTVSDVYSLSAFFLDWCKALTKATQTSLVRKLKKMARKEKGETKAMMEQAIRHLEQGGAMSL